MSTYCWTCMGKTDGPSICASCEWASSGRDVPRIEYYDELEAEAAALRDRVKELEQSQQSIAHVWRSIAFPREYEGPYQQLHDIVQQEIILKIAPPYIPATDE